MLHQNYYLPGYEPTIALIDTFYRMVWLTSNEEKICHRIRKVFVGKLTLTVYDIRSFANYTENLIDNEVCMDWRMSPSNVTLLIEHSLHFREIAQTQQAQNQTLINEPTDMPLVPARRQDLQKQLMLYHVLLQDVDDSSSKLSDIVDDIFSVELSYQDVLSALASIPFDMMYDSFLGRKILKLTNKLYA